MIDTLYRHKKLALPFLCFVALAGVGIPDLYGVAEIAQASAENADVSWISILPPLVAILLALLFRQVLLSLFLGIWMGAFLVSGQQFGDIFTSFFHTITGYIVPATADEAHMSIIVFSLLIGGMIGIISKNGGTRGIIRIFTRYVKSKTGGQLTTSLMGFLIFFDDYANTMVVGNTMRPLTDKLRISRAKLAFLVDATAAPIATVALVSTWIGAMVGFISEAQAGMDQFNESAYLVFINSLPYNFYAFFTLFFVLLIAWSGRDFGPMLKSRLQLYKAKVNSKLDTYGVYKEGATEEKEEKRVSHWLNAAVPIVVLVVTTIAALFVTGSPEPINEQMAGGGQTLFEKIQNIIASSDSYAALLWGSLLSVMTAFLMTISQGLLSADDTLEGMTEGMNVMFEGVLILVMAWSLSKVTVDLNTADYLISVFRDVLSPHWMPALVLLLSALTAFATGSSWGTMGILMPLVVPLAWSLGEAGGLDPETIRPILYASVSSVLAGSVWGDHCSPISDTTILSSLASQCDHIEHVNTQLPYSMVGGLLSLLACVAVLVMNIPWWVVYPIGALLIVAIILKFGKTPDPRQVEETERQRMAESDSGGY